MPADVGCPAGQVRISRQSRGRCSVRPLLAYARVFARPTCAWLTGLRGLVRSLRIDSGPGHAPQAIASAADRTHRIRHWQWPGGSRVDALAQVAADTASRTLLVIDCASGRVGLSRQSPRRPAAHPLLPFPAMDFAGARPHERAASWRSHLRLLAKAASTSHADIALQTANSLQDGTLLLSTDQ